jgi:hypothetical protein
MHEVGVSKGRLLFRNLAQRQTAVVGLLHLPRDFEVTEGAAYVLILDGGEVSILAKPIDSGPPCDLVGQGINVALRYTGWMGTAIPKALCVRLCSAWPDAKKEPWTATPPPA